MPRVGRLDCIHRQRTYGIDGELVDGCCFYLCTHECAPLNDSVAKIVTECSEHSPPPLLYPIRQSFSTKLSSPLSSIVIGRRFSITVAKAGRVTIMKCAPACHCIVPPVAV